MVPKVAALIEAAHAAQCPVIYTIFDNTHQGLDRPASGGLMPNRYPHIPGEGQEQWFVRSRVYADLTPRAGDLILRKPSYGAFYDTPLDTILRNLGRDTIIVSGTLTNFCCGATARQGYERGYFVVFGSDVTATDDPELQEAELMVQRKGFARVMTGAEIEAALSSPHQIQGQRLSP